MADLAASIVDQVRDAVKQGTAGRRGRALETVARIAYEQAGGARDVEQDFVNSLAPAFARTAADADPDQVAAVIATAAANHTAMSKAADGAKLTWVTMRDDKVRDIHRPLDGHSVSAGNPFNVGGHPLYYPGQPVGPPEVWINCRCRLDVSAAESASGIRRPDASETSRPVTPPPAEPGGPSPFPEGTPMETPIVAAISEEPWSNFSASDYSIEQWRRACLITMPGGNADSKSTYKLPVRTPNGAVSRAGVHAAAAALGGARGGVDAPASEKAKARRALRGLYRTLGDEPPDSLAAAGPVDTHDAPGWLTNPKETERLRRYWTRGEGAAKIGWGSPGDFNRCRQHLGKYVATPYLAGTCANLHYVALGFWPATHAKMDRAGRKASLDMPLYDPDNLSEEDTAVATAFIAAAQLPTELPPGEWFADPHFDAATPLTVTSDGRVLGHLATWGTCHVGFEDRCVTASPSRRNYADFLTGEVDTSDGPVPVGNITMDTGHAPLEAGPTAAVAHYDDTGTVIADVNAGEDAYGIWVAGQLRPGVDDSKVRALRAGALSGDWRRIGGHLELVAALVVNVPGFPIPRVQVATVGERDMALVAAAIVSTDPGVDADRIAATVIRRLDQRESDRARRLRAADVSARMRALRAAAVIAEVG